MNLLKVSAQNPSKRALVRANQCSHCRYELRRGCPWCGGNGRAARPIRRSNRLDTTETAVLSRPSSMRRTTSRIQVGTPETHGTSLSFSARHPNTKSLPASETAVASEPVAVSFLQGSRWFAPLDATPSLHSCPRGQARSCLHWRGGGNIGRLRGISTRLHRVGAWTSTRQRADSVVRSSQGLFCGHSLE
jgi:hypothetical protein